MDVISNKNRKLELIATFQNGYAEGWHFKVHEAFKDALDIKFTDRKVKGVLTQVWTQGMLYDFKSGDLFYEHNCINEIWEESLKYIKNVLQVESASPCFLIDDKTENKKKIYKLSHGNVKFKVLQPNSDKSALIQTSTKECSQIEFVNILKNGFGADNNQPLQQALLFE